MEPEIRAHGPYLRAAAQGVVVELCYRVGVATPALLAGIEAHGGQLISVVPPTTPVPASTGHAAWTLIQAESRDPATAARVRAIAGAPIHLLLLDTAPTREQVEAELACWSPLIGPGGRICVHDAVFSPGVRRAVESWAAAKGWPLIMVLPDNGLAILEAPQ